MCELKQQGGSNKNTPTQWEGSGKVPWEMVLGQWAFLVFILQPRIEAVDCQEKTLSLIINFIAGLTVLVLLSVGDLTLEPRLCASVSSSVNEEVGVEEL